MARSRDLLNRFRPAGTPGAAAVRGVPADRSAELSAELEPVLALLAATEDEVRRTGAAARAEADRRRREAEDRARALVAAARRDAESERADAAARVAERAGAETEATLAAGAREAEEVRRRAGERMPGYVAQVVDAVRAELGVAPR